MVQRDDTDTDTAAGRLHQLRLFLQRPVTGPEGHSYTPAGCRTAPTAPPLPFDARVLEHIDTTVAEVVAYTRAVNPEAGPLPQHVTDTYAWARKQTEHAPAIEQQRRDTLEYRHRLEHAIAAGDNTVVRPHRCPSCGTIGLHWPQGVMDPTAKATCVNVRCARRNKGVHQTWSLSELAYEHVAIEKSRQACAT